MFFALLTVILLVSPNVAAESEWQLSLQVDLGSDQGQNYGTLFELTDNRGRAIAGAGYVGSYNTQSRGDRRTLHFFIKPQQDIPFRPVKLPRPSSDTGTYLYDFEGAIYSKGRGGNDRRLRTWNTASEAWENDDQNSGICCCRCRPVVDFG